MLALEIIQEKKKSDKIVYLLQASEQLTPKNLNLIKANLNSSVQTPTNITSISSNVLLFKERLKVAKEVEEDFKGLNNVTEKMSGITETLSKSFKLLAGIAVGSGIALFSIINLLAQKDSQDKGLQTPTRIKKMDSGSSTGEISSIGLDLIKKSEGLRLEAYQCQADVWTIGYGHTGLINNKKITSGMTITREQAENLLKQDVKRFEAAVNRLVKVPISQNMFDALVSFCFNLGEGALAKSTLLKKLNEGDYSGAQAQFKQFNKANKKVSQGLVKRRAEEAELFKKDIGKNNNLNIEYHLKDGTNIKRYANGTQINGYTLNNPASQRKYIDLSSQAETYLKQTEGTGIITSGAEGTHAKGKLSHKSGNKIDVAIIGSSNLDWAKTALPFIKNPNTVYINFEDFSPTQFNAIKAELYKLDPNIKTRCESTIKESFSSDRKFMFRSWTGGGLHLDIAFKLTNFEEDLHPSNLTTPKSIENKQEIKEQFNQINNYNTIPNSTQLNTSTNSNLGTNLSQNSTNIIIHSSKYNKTRCSCINLSDLVKIQASYINLGNINEERIYANSKQSNLKNFN